MATRKEITADIRDLYGNTMSKNQVRQYLRMGKKDLDLFLRDVPYIPRERKKTYLTIDVARKIADLQLAT